MISADSGPTKEEVEIARRYLQMLDSLKTDPSEPLPEHLLIGSTPMWLGVIKRLGDGDIELAAQKHIKAINSVYEKATPEQIDKYHDIINSRSETTMGEFLDEIFRSSDT